MDAKLFTESTTKIHVQQYMQIKLLKMDRAMLRTQI